MSYVVRCSCKYLIKRKNKSHKPSSSEHYFADAVPQETMYQTGLDTTTKLSMNAVCSHTAIPTQYQKTHIASSFQFINLNLLEKANCKEFFFLILLWFQALHRLLSSTHSLRSRDTQQTLFTTTKLFFHTVNPLTPVQKHQQRKRIRSLFPSGRENTVVQSFQISENY